ncbi:hypothetical protein [Pyxidicoccus sp. MSG2]|uniref:hypothetical protein n=1 Tax=Pyxidicoccus sp. MSG2 TaxID=2996790 RepID=UPI00227144A1|nr:hypothetical protein [Pyxidicoccus sp. MSG2]MCY1016329.1 hypothetical protein [Pyxidicoccus sp. MSG2]
MRGAFLLAGVVMLAGCHRGATASSPAPSQGFAGHTLPLLASPALRLTVAGRLGTRSVPVVLDVARPLSLVSKGCFEGPLPAPEGTVRAPEPAGGFRSWSVVRLPAFSVGPVVSPMRTAGLSGERACAVTLGADVLEPYALTVDPLRREVVFAASRPREAYAAEAAASEASREVHVVELSREPLGDWPLLAARVRQGEADLTGPFVLGSREPFSRLAVGPAEAQGLQPLETAANLPARTFAVDAVEVSEGVGARPLVVEAAGRWDSPSSLGRLGPDVWGRFTATLDAKGGALVLRRPRVGPLVAPSASAEPPPASGPVPSLAPSASAPAASASAPGSAPSAAAPAASASAPGSAPSASAPAASASAPGSAPSAAALAASASPPAPSERQHCASPGGTLSEEACYGLYVRREPDGSVSVSGAVYRDLPEGGRLHLEPVGADGQRLETGCGVGLSFPSTSRGLTTQHRLPWTSLAQALPACHAALATATGFKLALFEEGRQPECPTACAFVTEAASRRTVCECQPTPLGEGVGLPSRTSPSREPPPEERELEPEDPK